MLVHHPDDMIRMLHAVAGKLQADHLVDGDAIGGGEIQRLGVIHGVADIGFGLEAERQPEQLDFVTVLA